jgi:thioredoxin 1
MTIPRTQGSGRFLPFALCLLASAFCLFSSCSQPSQRFIGTTFHEPEGTHFVDFQATWCGPCRALKPTIERLKTEFPEVTFPDIDVDEEPNLAAQYEVSSIPHCFVAVDGKITKRFVGVAAYEELKGAIEKAVAAASPVDE